jgi:hypothetical protein
VTILHWTKAGEPLRPGKEPLIAVGVRGLAFDMTSGIYIPLVIANNPGSGDVSRMLDGLPRDRRIVFSTVLNAKLREMLFRRGFKVAWDTDGECEILERLPAREPA